MLANAASNAALVFVHEIRVYHQDDLFQLPDVPGDSRRDCWRSFERAVFGAKIVAHQAERDHVAVVFEFLAELRLSAACIAGWSCGLRDLRAPRSSCSPN